MRRSRYFFPIIILGVVLLCAGILYGIGSHQVTYQNVGQGTVAHYLSLDGTGYLQMSGSPDLYAVKENDFTPKINSTTTLRDSDTISFTYDPTDTQNIDETSTLGTHLVGSAANVVSITLTNADTNQTTTFSTTQYTQNPQGFYKNDWLIGGFVCLVGLIVIGGSFFLPRRKAESITGVTPTIGTPQMPQQPYSGQSQYSAYPPQQPPYQGSQYPQYPPQNRG